MNNPFEENSRPAQLNDKTVLVVDDDPAICDMITNVLSRENIQVVSTVRSKEALTYLNPGSYLKIDLIITDLQMPSYGGFSFIKDLQLPQYEPAPVLVVTGRNLDQQTIDMISLESNVKGIFKKPVSIKNFVQKVHEILGTVSPNPPTSNLDL